MKQCIVITMLLWSVHFFVNAEESGFSEIPVLDYEHYSRFGTYFHQNVADAHQRKAALALLSRFDIGLKRLSLSEIALQLQHWIYVRGSLPVETVEDLAVSNLLGVLVNDVAAHAIEQLQFSLYAYEEKRLPLHEGNIDILNMLERACANNFNMSTALRPYVLTFFGTPGDIQTVFTEIVEESEERSREGYIEEMGDNPLSMSRIDQKSFKGLKSLREQALVTWDDVVKEPTSFPAKAYFVASDLYVAYTFFEIHLFLTEQGLPRDTDKEQEFLTAYQNDIWYERFVQKSENLAEIQRIVTESKYWFDLRNRLLLQE